MTKECMNCINGQQGFLLPQCLDCYNFHKFEPVSVYPKDVLTSWIKEDHSVANKVADGHGQFHSVSDKGIKEMTDIEPDKEIEVETDYWQTFDRCSTDVTVKEENFDSFVQLIRNQFSHGGNKYAGKSGKEFTDMICEAFPGTSGVDWVLGTCMKYMGRYKNFGREKDLLKVATYMFILWLKGGFHLKDDHDEDIFIK